MDNKARVIISDSEGANLYLLVTEEGDTFGREILIETAEGWLKPVADGNPTRYRRDAAGFYQAVLDCVEVLRAGPTADAIGYDPGSQWFDYYVTIREDHVEVRAAQRSWPNREAAFAYIASGGTVATEHRRTVWEIKVYDPPIF